VFDTRRLVAEGAEAFNRGEFFAAHELWERVWLELAGAERRWLKGLIQIAAGLHKQARPEACGALLRKGLAKLVDAPDDLLGIGAGALARDTAALVGETNLAPRLRISIL
jgi:predicted metal-dependent hydrolase